MTNCEDLVESNVKKGDIPGKQSIAIVVCIEYGAIVFDS